MPDCCCFALFCSSFSAQDTGLHKGAQDIHWQRSCHIHWHLYTWSKVVVSKRVLTGYIIYKRDTFLTLSFAFKSNSQVFIKTKKMFIAHNNAALSRYFLSVFMICQQMTDSRNQCGTKKSFLSGSTYSMS